MISDTTRQKLLELYKTQDAYRASSDIAEQLADKTLVMFIGASGQGKNTIMEAVTKLNGQFQTAGNHTTRAPRDSDDPSLYTYHEYSDTGFAPIFSMIDRHELVQYVVNLHSYLMYFRTPDNFASNFPMTDTLSNVVDSHRKLGFKRAIAITIVSQPQQWLQRFNERFPVGHPDRKARRDEAIESLKWSLAQTGPDHYWAENVQDKPELAAQAVLDIALNGSTGQLHAKALAASSLDHAREIAI